MQTIHPVEDSIHELRLVERINDESMTELRTFLLLCTAYGNTNHPIGGIKNAEGLQVFGISETKIISGLPYPDRGTVPQQMLEVWPKTQAPSVVPEPGIEGQSRK